VQFNRREVGKLVGMCLLEGVRQHTAQSRVASIWRFTKTQPLGHLLPASSTGAKTGQPVLASTAQPTSKYGDTD
jgi:hypothetical protein